VRVWLFESPHPVAAEAAPTLSRVRERVHFGEPAR
jgi:hypothetical protein